LRAFLHAQAKARDTNPNGSEMNLSGTDNKVLFCSLLTLSYDCWNHQLNEIGLWNATE
jgi:hypothetical protein